MTKQEKSFEEVRSIIVTHRSTASRGVNTESILMSWKVGSYISARLQSNEWGSKVVTELSEYLRIQDPTLKGYSRRNLYNMVAFYEAYSAPKFSELEQKLLGDKIKQIQGVQIVQTASAQFAFPPQVLFLTTFSNHVEIINRCKSDGERLFYILYSFAEILFKDTAFVDFLNLPQKHTESKLKNGLVENMKKFVLELEKDFIFMESEYPVKVAETYAL